MKKDGTQGNKIATGVPGEAIKSNRVQSSTEF